MAVARLMQALSKLPEHALPRQASWLTSTNRTDYWGSESACVNDFLLFSLAGLFALC